MSRRGRGKVAASMSRLHDIREHIDYCEYHYENEIEKYLSLPCNALLVSANDPGTREEGDREVGKSEEQNIRRDESWAAATDQVTTKTKTSSRGRSDNVVEVTSIADKFSIDLEKWFQTHAEPTGTDVKVTTEDVDRYLDGEETLSSRSFLSKNPYGLSIDIDLAIEKKADLNLTDPILQNELPSERLLEEPCEKVDDECILSDLYHLDPLTLSPDDMIADEILPSTVGGQLNLAENQEIVRVKDVSRRIGEEVGLCGKSADGLHTDPGKRDKEMGRDGKAETTMEAVQSSGNPSELFMRVLVPVEAENSSSAVVQIPSAMMEQLKLKSRLKVQPRIIKKRRKMPERSEKRLEGHVNGDDCTCDSDQDDDVMAVVAISTDKTSNTTQIVINTGTEQQVYQGKTSELIEATGNFPKIDTSVAVWNGTSSVVECNGFDSDNRGGSGQYGIVISKAFEELGIADDSLQTVRVTEHDKVWLCPQNDCNRRFGRLYTLKGHLLAHYGVRPFKCDHEGCTWAFYSEFKLKRHKETHLKRKDHVCEVEGCNRRFTTVYNLWSHAKLHNRPNRMVCQVPDCNEKFQTKRALELHMKSHDQRHAPYVCQHKGCGKRYYSSNALTSHQRSHSYKEVDIKCSWPGCDKVFDKPCRLKAHTRSHTGCKPYHCTYQDCKWSFSSSSKLKRHQKKHTNERKFACDVPGCGKAFMRSEHLKEHRLTHTEGCRFHCFVCDARFSAKSSLYVHIKKHQTKTEELTSVAGDDVSLDDVGASGQRCARTKESHCSRVKPIKSRRRRRPRALWSPQTKKQS